MSRLLRNRWFRTTSIAACAAVLAVLPAAADQVVHFANGTTLPIRGHEVHDGMIHVDLGGDAAIAFPVAQVERITDSGQEVFRTEDWTPANVAAEGTAPRGRSGIRVQSRVSTGGPVFARDSARGGRAAAKRRDAPQPDNIQDLLAAAAASRRGEPEVGPGLRRGMPDHPNPEARSLRVAGRADSFAGANLQDGRTELLGVTVNGESKFMTPKMREKSSNNGVEVLRVRPSEDLARAAVAQGTPIELRDGNAVPPPQDASSGSSGSDAGAAD